MRPSERLSGSVGIISHSDNLRTSLALLGGLVGHHNQRPRLPREDLALGEVPRLHAVLVTTVEAQRLAHRTLTERGIRAALATSLRLLPLHLAGRCVHQDHFLS